MFQQIYEILRESFSAINGPVLLKTIIQRSVSMLKSLLSLHIKSLSLDTDSHVKLLFDLKLPRNRDDNARLNLQQGQWRCLLCGKVIMMLSLAVI